MSSETLSLYCGATFASVHLSATTDLTDNTNTLGSVFKTLTLLVIHRVQGESDLSHVSAQLMHFSNCYTSDE